MASSSSIDRDMAGCSAAGKAPNQPGGVVCSANKLYQRLCFSRGEEGVCVGRRQQASAQRVVGLQKLCLWTKVGHLGQREIVRAGWRSGEGKFMLADGRVGGARGCRAAHTNKRLWALTSQKEKRHGLRGEVAFVNLNLELPVPRDKSTHHTSASNSTLASAICSSPALCSLLLCIYSFTTLPILVSHPCLNLLFSRCWHGPIGRLVACILVLSSADSLSSTREQPCYQHSGYMPNPTKTAFPCLSITMPNQPWSFYSRGIYHTYSRVHVYIHPHVQAHCEHHAFAKGSPCITPLATRPSASAPRMFHGPIHGQSAFAHALCVAKAESSCICV